MAKIVISQSVRQGYRSMCRSLAAMYGRRAATHVEACAELASPLATIHDHVSRKEQMLDCLLIFCRSFPHLPVDQMYLQYSMCLDAHRLARLRGERLAWRPPKVQLTENVRSSGKRSEATYNTIVNAMVSYIMEGEIYFTRCDFVDKCGISSGAFTKYFPNMDELMLTAYGRILATTFFNLNAEPTS